MKNGTDNPNNLFFKSFGLEWSLSVCFDGVFRLQSLQYGKTDDLGAVQQLDVDLNENKDFSPKPLNCLSFANTTVVTDNLGNSCKVSAHTICFFDKHGNLKESIIDAITCDDRRKLTFSTDKNRRYYGTGERFDRVNQYGKYIDLFAVDKWCRTKGNSYCPIPFLISSECTGIFMNRFERQIFDIGYNNSTRLNMTLFHALIDLYVFLFDTPGEILYALGKLAGFAPMPPEWQFGTAVCRYAPDFSTPAGVYEMAKQMEENALPWDAVILEGWKVFDRKKHEALKQLTASLHEMGKKVLVYESCGRIKEGLDEAFGITDDLAVQGKNGCVLTEASSYNSADHAGAKTAKFIDITNPQAMQKWDELWQKLIFDIGIDGAKIDFCEQFPEASDLRFYDNSSPFGMHHRYPVVYNTHMHSAFSRKPDGGMNFSRGGGIGAARYPFIWAGDQRREFYFLRHVLKAVLSMGLSGVPFLSWDMAGYRHSFNPYDLLNEKKVFIRGVETAAFSANIQTHGKVKRPYDFDKNTVDIYRTYALIHEALKPYLLEFAKQATLSGMPLMRHLFLYDASDDVCRNTEDEYMLGDCFLVCPVLTHRTSRNIYLPKGKWINIFTRQSYEGRQTLKHYPVKIHEIPVFYLQNSKSETGQAVSDNVQSIYFKYLNRR